MTRASYQCLLKLQNSTVTIIRVSQTYTLHHVHRPFPSLEPQPLEDLIGVLVVMLPARRLINLHQTKTLKKNTLLMF